MGGTIWCKKVLGTGVDPARPQTRLSQRCPPPQVDESLLRSAISISRSIERDVLVGVCGRKEGEEREETSRDAGHLRRVDWKMRLGESDFGYDQRDPNVSRRHQDLKRMKV